MRSYGRRVAAPLLPHNKPEICDMAKHWIPGAAVFIDVERPYARCTHGQPSLEVLGGTKGKVGAGSIVHGSFEVSQHDPFCPEPIHHSVGDAAQVAWATLEPGGPGIDLFCTTAQSKVFARVRGEVPRQQGNSVGVRTRGRLPKVSSGARSSSRFCCDACRSLTHCGSDTLYEVRPWCLTKF